MVTMTLEKLEILKQELLNPDFFKKIEINNNMTNFKTAISNIKTAKFYNLFNENEIKNFFDEIYTLGTKWGLSTKYIETLIKQEPKFSFLEPLKDEIENIISQYKNKSHKEIFEILKNKHEWFSKVKLQSFVNYCKKRKIAKNKQYKYDNDISIILDTFLSLEKKEIKK